MDFKEKIIASQAQKSYGEKIVSAEYSNDYIEDLKCDEEYKKLCNMKYEELSKIDIINSITTLEYDERFSTLSSAKKESIKKFSNTQREKAKEIVESELKKIEQSKKNLYMNKRFSISIQEVKDLLNEYSKDSKNINIEDGMKEKLNLLSKTLESLEGNKNIDEMYNNVQKEMKPTDILNLKRELYNSIKKIV